MNKNILHKAFALVFILSALLLGFTQCKKEQIEPQGGKVSITLNVENGASTGSATGKATDGAKVEVTPPSVAFEEDDEILVVSNGHYVGTLTHDGSNFSGSITDPVEGQPLYFYFLGNKDAGTLSSGASGSTSCTINISDQTSELPVISMSPSDQTYPSVGNAYTASLHNKCSLMKFNVTTNSDANICITGMNNKVIVDFSKAANDGQNNGFSFGKESEGIIKAKPVSGTGTALDPVVLWAIVLPQDASPAARAYTSDYEYIGTRPAMEAITADQFIESGFAMEVNTVFNPYTTPLTFEAKTASAKVRFTKEGGVSVSTLQYKMNDGSWQNYTYGTDITLSNVGDKVSFRGGNAAYATSTSKYTKISCTGDCYIYGNIMSLVSMTDYADTKTLAQNYAFCQLFYQNSHIVNHPSKTLVLPATTLKNYCYQSMFYGCTGLTTAPELPATTLQSYCYREMFYGCSSLTTAPELPATTLAIYCYDKMFQGCTSLTTAPELPATTLANSCYYSMFQGCTSLTAAPVLPATTLDKYCYYSMFQGCTSLTTAPELPATTLANFCYNRMFQGCTSLTTAPALHATTLADHCYYYMFSNCTNLRSVTCLATSGINENYSTQYWLNGTATSGTRTFYKNKDASVSEDASGSGGTWPRSVSGIPSGWTYSNAN